MLDDQLQLSIDPVVDADDPPLCAWIQALIDQHGYGAVLTEVRRLAPSSIQASAPARASDPETSHMASKTSLDVGRFSSKAVVAKLLNQFSIEPKSDQQATMAIVGAHAAPSAFEGTRRRCSDLRAAHYIYDTGKRRKNLGSDDESTVWAVSEAGRRALVNLETTGWSK